MITLLPSIGVKKLTGINYDTLEWVIDKVLTANLGKSFNYNITIHKSRVKETSYVWLENRSRNFKIYLDCSGDMRYSISTILHEIRHILQHQFFKTSMACAFSTYKEYYNSAEERDARKFEKLTTSVLHTYKALEQSKVVFKKNSLGTSI